MISSFDLTLSIKNIETIAHISAVGTVSIYSFLGHKYFTFDEGIRVKFKELFSKTDDYKGNLK